MIYLVAFEIMDDAIGLICEHELLIEAEPGDDVAAQIEQELASLYDRSLLMHYAPREDLPSLEYFF